MLTKNRPFESHVAILNSFLDYAKVSSDEKKLLKSELRRYMEDRIKRGKWVHPIITKFHTDWYREIYRLVDHKDPYDEIKKRSNEEASEVLNKINPINIKEKIMLSIIGNKIDFGACMDSVYDINSLHKEAALASEEELFIDDTDFFLNRIDSAQNVFYLFDNNGELIFDELLLRHITQKVEKNKIFLIAKESPMLNDVTTQDLKDYGFEKYGTIVSTGSNCFGLHEEDVSQDFKENLRTADLIVAKGQAYFEFFMHYNFENVIHLLRVKHRIIGSNIPDLEKGMNVVMSSHRYAGKGYDYKFKV